MRFGLDAHAHTGSTPPWTLFMSLGDSFSEGMVDPSPQLPGTYRGWADITAQHMHRLRVDADASGLLYMNTAIRGRRIARIVAEQLPAAMRQLRIHAGDKVLVSLVAGGNDIMRVGYPVEDVARILEDAVARLRAAGADVLLCMGPNPRTIPLLGSKADVIGAFNASVASIAHRHGCYLFDLWGLAPLYDLRMWGADRIHASTPGHFLIASEALRTLGVDCNLPGFELQNLPPLPDASFTERARQEARWAWNEVAPWVGRRLRRRSSGDGLDPKLPVPTEVSQLLGPS